MKFKSLDEMTEEEPKKLSVKQKVGRIMLKYSSIGGIAGGLIGGIIIPNYFNEPIYLSIMEGVMMGGTIGLISAVYEIDRFSRKGTNRNTD